MNFYLAPIEGVTGYIYRNAHHKLFKGIDKYFAPFIMANGQENLKSKDFNDISKENNQGIYLVPQLLTNNSKDFMNTATKIINTGYKEINLNLGCPSGTVVAKSKGAGFLSKPKELNEFFKEIYQNPGVKISVKTRLGIEKPEEFQALLDIYNQYPLEELIIHPRVQKDFYKNTPNLEVFGKALECSTNPVVYNGDIFSLEDYSRFRASFPTVNTIMIGRGVLKNPGFIELLIQNKVVDKNRIMEFHNTLYEEYKKILFGEKNVLFKMKELWVYMIDLFPENQKFAKKIRKAERFADYDEAVRNLFSQEISVLN